MSYSKLLAVFGGLVLGAGLFVGDSARAVFVDAAPQAGKGEQPRVDLWGDPLPMGALARLGTIRYRSGEPLRRGGIGILADSKTVVIGTPEGHTLQLMEAATGKVVREISTGNISINNFTALSNGETIAVIGKLPEKADGTSPAAIGIVDIASGKLIHIHEKLGMILNISGHAGVVTSDAKFFVSADHTGLVRIQDVATGAEIRRHQFTRDGSPALAVSRDGSTVAFAPGPNTAHLYLWKWQEPGEPREIKTPDRDGNQLTFAPDGKTLVECARAIVRVWDVANGQLLHTLVPPEKGFSRASSAVFTPDGKTIIVAFQGNDSSALHFWDAATGKHHNWLAGPVGNVLVSTDSKLLVAMGGGGFRAWEWGTWRELSASAKGQETSVERVFVKGNVVISCGDDTIRVWDAATAKQRFTLTHDHHGIGPDIAHSPDGTKLASVSFDDSVCLWDVTTGKKIYKLPGHGRVGARGVVGFTADGKHFLSYGWDKYLRKWDVATGEAVLEHKIPNGKMMPGLSNFSPDGSLFILDSTNEFHVFDVSSGKELFQVVKEPVKARSLAFSHDGRMLLASVPGKIAADKLPDGTIRIVSDKNDSLTLWELATRQIRMKTMYPEGGVGPVAFSADSKRFAIAINGPNRRVHIYDMAGGKEIAVIEGYRGTVHSLASADDGQRLATGMSDTTVLLWDVAAFKK